MSNHTDKMTMQQNAMSIKSQRKQRIEENKQQEKIEEDNKDIQIIFEALSRMRKRGITDTSEFTWKIMYNEHKQNKNDKNNNNVLNYDEKENENKKINKNKKISQLIDVKYNQM
eukprot:209540_1